MSAPKTKCVEGLDGGRRVSSERREQARDEPVHVKQRHHREAHVFVGEPQPRRDVGGGGENLTMGERNLLRESRGARGGKDEADVVGTRPRRFGRRADAVEAQAAIVPTVPHVHRGLDEGTEFVSTFRIDDHEGGSEPIDVLGDLCSGRSRIERGSSGDRRDGEKRDGTRGTRRRKIAHRLPQLCARGRHRGGQGSTLVGQEIGGERGRSTRNPTPRGREQVGDRAPVSARGGRCVGHPHKGYNVVEAM